ncbi:thiamine pyrophosphate-requiring protein [Gordonia sp. TBRC 11910]|uniref:acetolactate synthase n=1 Tax=Gordonia asplenii TaxID=2725283 RepID=A0A848L4L9_9ACTN|nr:thiamine pyrophosphate-requiring protein [Gordonia asplenii]NMO03531.1 thiamine pyrophosphate-requiring protein [Gordonia asplenii]
MAHTAASRYLTALAERGIESLFVNAGTDFAPIVEAYAANLESGGPTLPTPIICAHENLAGGMAHGAALLTGKPQALMVHVNVGTANVACSVANASRDRIPLLVTAGRSPIIESGAVGDRDLPIHWSQEMYDQASIVREFVKWDYELRDPRQVDAVVDRALSMATAQPQGPIYLSLPREVLAESADEPQPQRLATPVPTTIEPDPAAVAQIADRIAAARFPVIVATGAGQDPAAVALLEEAASRFGIGVADPWARYLNIASDHPRRIGSQIAEVFRHADVVVFLESDVPWIPKREAPAPDTFIAQVGVDPLFSAYPIRSHRSDLNVSATSAAFLTELIAALDARADDIDLSRSGAIEAVATQYRAGVAALRAQEAAVDDETISAAAISAVLGELLDDDDIVFNEYVSYPDLLARTKPGTYYFLPASGGLGWGLPAALGAKFAAPERTVVATLGDGAYMFANPAACHHAAAKHDLPVLTIIANNSNWGAVDGATELAYPAGVAVANAERRFSDLSPSPDLAAYCTASGGFGVTVRNRSELADALKAALHAVRVDKRQALVDVRTA